ncbi:MAG: hypothetical protein F6K58_05440 [Symploca sp. SIO2E9]|nr:hypothetical protein [Symploca sp. SIO2E9]
MGGGGERISKSCKKPHGKYPKGQHGMNCLCEWRSHINRPLVYLSQVAKPKMLATRST